MSIKSRLYNSPQKVILIRNYVQHFQRPCMYVQFRSYLTVNNAATALHQFNAT